MTNKLLALVLACLLALSALSLVACGPDTPAVDPSNPTDPTTPDTPAEEGLTATTVLSAFPDRDYGGEEIMIMAASNHGNVIFIDQFTNDDDINGDIVHDSLFKRDKMIEAKFGIDLYYDDVGDGEMVSQKASGIRAGDDEYSLILAAMHNTAIPLMNQQLTYDLSSIDTIDLTQSWWNQNSVKAMTVNGITYMATGAITNRSVFAPYAMFFNNRLLEATNLDNPYDLIEMDQWTFENFEYMIMGTSYEINSNDKMEVDDFYGYAPASDSEGAFVLAVGGAFSQTDDNGNIIPAYDSAENFELIEMISEFYASEDVLKYVQTYDSVTAFKEGRAIFHAMAMGDITLISDMEDKYGIVPLPKLNDEQENYVSGINKYISTMAVIPTSVRDTDKIGEIVEALAAVSQYTSLDTQYEAVLLNRKALDAESKRNLQLVVESSTYDWVWLLNPAGVEQSIRLGIKNNTELSSTFASVRDQVEAELEIFMELYQ